MQAKLNDYFFEWKYVFTSPKIHEKSKTKMKKE